MPPHRCFALDTPSSDVEDLILLIDNYDSFVHNLARYFQRLGQQTDVVRNDDIRLESVARMSPEAIVISPGPRTPDQAGCSIDVVQRFSGQLPILGVCLGHQVIVNAFGGRVVRANEPMHGRASCITHDGRGVFREIPSPLTVCRYHSLVADPASMPSCLAVSASAEDGTIMAIRHRQHRTIGLQFHPEAVLTHCGIVMLSKFLVIAGVTPAGDERVLRNEELRVKSVTKQTPTCGTPVTF